MRLTADERDEKAERELRDQQQRELEAFNEGRRAGMLALAAGLCPEYPSEAERREWLRGRLLTLPRAA